MATGSRVTVTTSPTSLVTATGGPGQGEEGKYVVRNRGAVAVDLGGATVASGAGFELDASEAVSFELARGDSVYAITASGTCRVDVLRVDI